MPAPAGVLFDAGGTLVQVRTDALAEALRARGHDPHEVDEAFWRTMVLLDAEFGPQAGDWGAWFPRWVARFAERCRVPEVVLAEAWADAERDRNPWDHPVPGAQECLVRLRDAGIAVGVVSNADGRIGDALERAGLAHLLDVIVDSGVVGVAKPDPAIFAHALEPLGLAPEQTWYLGDTVLYDAAAADAAGLQSWVVDHRGLHTVSHPRRVSSLRQFADVVLASRS